MKKHFSQFFPRYIPPRVPSPPRCWPAVRWSRLQRGRQGAVRCACGPSAASPRTAATPSPPPSAASTCRTTFSPSLPAGGRRWGGRLRDPSRAPAATPASAAARTGSLTSIGSRMVQDARRSGPPPSSTPPDPRRPRAGCRASAEGRRQPGTVVRPAPPAVVAAGPKSLPLGCRHPEPRRKPPG